MESSYTITLSILTASLFICLSCASPTKFLRTSCKPTSYPSVCVQSLSAYSSLLHRSPRHLADVALSLSATRAHEASTYLSNLSSGNTKYKSFAADAVDHDVYNAIRDCMITMSDSAIRLHKSVNQLRKLGRMNRPSFALRLGNVLTWVSAALTDQQMCLNSLMESNVDSNTHIIIRKKVLTVSKVTSNALSLVNRLGSGN